MVSLQIRAGRELTTFEVRVSAPNASDLSLVVSVNERGEFAMLDVVAQPLGPLVAEGTLRAFLWDQSAAGPSCGDISPYAPPATPRVKHASAADAILNFGALEPSHGYTLLVTWEETGSLYAAGCTEIPATALVPGAAIRVLVPIHLTNLRPQGPYVVKTRLLVGRLDLITGAFGFAACPLGPADLILDCLLDAFQTSGEDPLDCVPSQEDLAQPVAITLSAHRGALLPTGCHDASIIPTVQSPSLESVLHNHLASSDPALASALAVAVAPDTVSRALAEATLSSELTFEPTPSEGHFVARHVLTKLVFLSGQGDASWKTDLWTLGLPHLVAQDIAARRLATGEVAIAQHKFSLRFGRLARQALGELIFAPLGLPKESSDLVTLLLQAIASDHGSACEALDALLCDAAGLQTGCLPNCEDALARLPSAFDARFRALDGGADFMLEGTARLANASSGPEATSLQDGLWTVGLGPSSSRITFAATFAGEAAQP